ncbi:MAG: SHOCT domain-containing protein [Erysipelotrichaceae bacterium]|nr:SHOCT domain-containing protein [Erysipelotrichaceae bacterium]
MLICKCECTKVDFKSLLAWKELLDKGIIIEEEFNDKKAKILNKK